ncbi:MAG: hypothetical protein JWM06_1399 [Actinomycetia bacterium]|jgi:hypothetical protein|nr:hypothetical protein [Actinomycetes bacterium]
MEHPKDVGDRTTLAVMLALGEAGYDVLLPFGENMRYDLVIDDGRILSRVQCKTGRLSKGAVIFRTASSYYHHPNPGTPSKHYQGQVDFFGVYCRATTGVYLVPIDELPNQWSAALRVTAPRNAQTQGIRLASRYEIGRVDLGARPRLRVPSGA